MCKHSAFLGLLLLFVIPPSLAIDDVTPADRNTLEQRQKALLEQNRQQRAVLENAALGLSAASRRINQAISLGVPLHFPHQLHPDNAAVYWQVNLPVSAFFR